MANYLVVGILVVCLSCAQASSELQVAFLCNRPAMHLTENGWTKDDNTNCLRDPVDVLNYCRKVYPDYDVRNVVEATELVTINNWCTFGHNRCTHKFTVRPFRCLVGSFESDSLAVPRHCVFDHIHDSTECKSYSAWNQSAMQACLSRGMRQHGFAILQPCGIDKFSGAEFVCCPENENDQKSVKPVARDAVSTAPKLLPPTKAVPTQRAALTPTSGPDTDAYARYLHAPRDSELSEHEYYLKAKSQLQKRHHDRVTKMMKDWASARQRVQEVKLNDVKAGEKMNREITARFQKLYESLEREGSAERKQLTSVHQQRVQADLNEKKRLAMDSYMQALSDIPPVASRVYHALAHYIKVEQKDRVHAVSHYQRVEESDPVEAEDLRSDVADHLRTIDERVTQAVSMLDRLDEGDARKVRVQIEKLLSTYQSLDESLSVIMTKINEKSSATSNDDVTDTPLTATTIAKPQPRVDLTQEAVEQDRAATAREAMSSAIAVTSLTQASEHTITDRKYHFVELKPVAGHVERNDISVLEKYIQKSPLRTDGSGNLAAPLGIAAGTITVFIVLVVGVMLVRRRGATHTVPETDHRAEVDEVSAKSAGVPINGYENPTYRYFEANGNIAA